MKKKKMPVWATYTLLIILFLSCYIGIYFLKGYPEQVSPTIFQNDYAELKQVTDYLISLDQYDLVIIEKEVDSFSIIGGSEVRIQEKQICSTISNLFEKGYDSIVKTEGGVSFRRWSSFKGKSNGFAFYPDKTKEFPSTFVIKRKQMSGVDWYFYEVDYERWRTLKLLNQENT